MKYSDIYLVNHDVDWFSLVNGVYIHVASAGGVIPDFVNDDEQLRIVQHQVEMLPFIYGEDEIEFNDVAIQNVLGDNNSRARLSYIESFKVMAQKGFFSYDRTNIGEPLDNRYHLVCRPLHPDQQPQVLNLPVFDTEISILEWIRNVTRSNEEQSQVFGCKRDGQ